MNNLIFLYIVGDRNIYEFNDYHSQLVKQIDSFLDPI